MSRWPRAVIRWKNTITQGKTLWKFLRGIEKSRGLDVSKGSTALWMERERRRSSSWRRLSCADARGASWTHQPLSLVNHALDLVLWQVAFVVELINRSASLTMRSISSCDRWPLSLLMVTCGLHVGDFSSLFPVIETGIQYSFVVQLRGAIKISDIQNTD
jgi:hypothetical protein